MPSSLLKLTRDRYSYSTLFLVSVWVCECVGVRGWVWEVAVMSCAGVQNC